MQGMDSLTSAFTHDSLVLALVVLIKLGVATLLASLIGYEREVHGRPAGMRTHMLVVIGTVLFCEVSRAFGGSDPARIAAQIVTGIGFLGAGVILRLGAKVKGLTTAASVWSVAAIGMAVSAGGPLLLVAVAATLLAYATLAVMARIEHRIAPQANSRVMVVQLAQDAQVSQFVQQLYVLHADVELVRVRSREPLVLAVELSSAPDSLLASIAGIAAVAEAGWEP